MAAPAIECPPAEAEKRVVVIDDDEIMLLSCSEILTRAGLRVEAYSSGEEGLRRIEEAPPPLLFVDLKMPKIDGMEVVRRVRQLAPSVVIVVVTGYATIATAVDAMKAGAYDFLPKPFTPEELSLIVRRGMERHELGRESERLRAEKEQMQRRFLTFVSHQLKTPLAAVKQYLDVLMYTSSGQLSEKGEEWIRRSQLRLQEALALIKDWLDLSRLEHGQIACRDASCDLAEVLRGTLQAHAAMAEKARVVVNVAPAPPLPRVRGDAGCIGMLLANLVSNAIKYNRPGGQVAIELRPGGSEVVASVRDTGLGIPADGLARVFEEFHRVRTAATEDVPGTGLGLAICKRIVGELGGDIGVESEEGSGSTFTIRLPVAGADGSFREGAPPGAPSEER